MPFESSRRSFLALTTASAALNALRPGANPAPPPSKSPAKLSSNENPYGPGPRARAAIAAAMDRYSRYNFDSYQALLGALAQAEGVNKESIVVGAGSGELLHMVALEFMQRNNLVCAWPTYGQLMSYAEKLGGRVVKVPLDREHRHDLAALAAARNRKTAVIYVCNPNNPTGTVVAGKPLREFCRTMSRTALVVVDEAYVELAAPGATESMVDLARAGANVLILRTFSKLHGLAGLRVGYGVGPPEIIRRLRGVQMTYPNTPGLEGARASLGDRNFLAMARQAIVTDRARMVAACRQLRLEVAEPHGNFIFFDTRRPAREFASAMLTQGVEVGRPFEPYLNWSRVSVGTTAETDRFIAAMRVVLG